MVDKSVLNNLIPVSYVRFGNIQIQHILAIFVTFILCMLEIVQNFYVSTM
jgi:hypothetical protein